MADNNNLHISRVGRTDEFYTQLSTIEAELDRYCPYFKDQIVLCNCDNPYKSNFFKYFVLNFRRFGLKKLVATCFADPQLCLETAFSDHGNPYPYKIEITTVPARGCEDDPLPDVDALLKEKGNTLTVLNGNGDFRSGECEDILKACDIVVTNPPFSLMREYLPTVINSGKKFIILGNVNHITLMEIKPYILSEACRLGYHSGHFWFMVPNSYDEKGTDYKQDESGQKWRRMGNSCWFTNFDIPKHHIPLELRATYDEESYLHYDDYDAIECGTTRELPKDYFGVIGVPITYLPYHCSDQFEILDIVTPRIQGKSKYKRLLIRRRDKR